MRWFRTVSIVGGTSFGYQTRALSKPVDLIVATPGRLTDLMQSGKVDFERLEVLILDEADRMLDMGFIDDIETIVEATPADRQTLLFSATWDGAVGKLARKLTKDSEIIEVERVDGQGKSKSSCCTATICATKPPARPHPARCQHRPMCDFHVHQSDDRSHRG
ncbi:ATP-dependent RNA helicase [Neisseria gonorrhoeae]|uniref:ATP-dependent RNA helicase n=1 Tax=Neisseria gonorrhoeae TaxID=485 RepID=A0A378VZL9_NEIGO|nr:ATP-dependent RNA helicase [Neisseria gonorrhoeae]